MVMLCVYLAWYPVRGIVQSALHFTPWHNCSFQHRLDLSITVQRLFTHTFPPLLCSQALIYTAK